MAPAKQVVEDRPGHGRREFFRAQAVASTHHAGRTGQRGSTFRKCDLHVEVEGFAEAARLLGPVQDRQRTHGFRQGFEECRDKPRVEQPDGEHAHFLALRVKPLGGFAQGVDRAPHRDHDPLGLGVPVVIVQPIRATGPLGQPVHQMLHDARDGLVKAIHRFTTLEVHVGILRRAANHRVFRRETP